MVVPAARLHLCPTQVRSKNVLRTFSDHPIFSAHDVWRCLCTYWTLCAGWWCEFCHLDANNKQKRAMNLDTPWTETAQNYGLTFMVTWSIPLPAPELVLGGKLPEVCLEPSSSSFSLCPQPTGDSEEARDGSSCRFRPKMGRHTYTYPK